MGGCTEEAPAHFFEDFSLYNFGGTARIDHENTFNLAPCYGKVRFMHAVEELAVFLLKTVFIRLVIGGVFQVSPSRAFHAVRDF